MGPRKKVVKGERPKTKKSTTKAAIKNQTARLDRLVKRVTAAGKDFDAVLLYRDLKGEVKCVGPENLARKVLEDAGASFDRMSRQNLHDPSLNEDRVAVLPEGGHAVAARHNPDEYFGDTSPEFRQYLRQPEPNGPSWKEVRDIVTTLVRGKKPANGYPTIRNFWRLAKIPEWWVPDIDFVSPHYRDQEGHKSGLSKADCIRLIEAYLDFDRSEKIAEGEDEDEDDKKMEKERAEEDEKSVENEMADEDQKSESQSHQRDIITLYQQKKYHEIHGIMMTCDTDNLKLELESCAAEILLDAAQHQQPVTRRPQGKHVLGYVPPGYELSDPGTLLDCLSDDTDRLRVEACLYSLVHCHHLISERRREGLSEEASKEVADLFRLGFSASNMQIDPSTLQCLAGSLGALVELWDAEEGSFIVYTPCPCQHVNSPNLPVISLCQYEDSWVLVQPPSRRTRGRGTQQIQIPSSKVYGQDKRVGESTVLPVYGGDINTLGPRQWLNDRVIDATLRLITRRTDVYIHSAFFVVKLLGYRKKLNSPLEWSRYDPKSVKKWGPQNQQMFKYVLIPVCDRSHWFLAVVEPSTTRLHVCCSQQLDHTDVVKGIARYYSEKLGQTVSVQHHKEAQQQKNGYDCGLFLIGYAKHIIAKDSLDLSQVEVPSRTQVAQSLTNM